MDTILIVEDDKNLLAVLSGLLKDVGYEVLSTMWGSMAIEEVKKGMADLVLLDIMLPGMNGMEVLEKIKDIDKRLPVIMITGYGSAESAVRAIELGAYDYINKPFDYDKLVFKINKALVNSSRRKRGVLMRQIKKYAIDIGEYRKNIFHKLKKRMSG